MGKTGTDAGSPRPPRPSRPPSWRWWISGLLLLITTIIYMDRVALGSASVRVTRDLGLSDAQYGNLELAFGWAFAVGSLGFGILADRLNVYFLYPGVMLAWSLVCIATGWAEGYLELLLCRTLLGCFEAAQWPCALKTTFALFDEKDRAMGNSVTQSGSAIGAVIMPQAMKLIMTERTGSWRAAFIVVGTVGLLWVGAWLLCLRSRDLGPEGDAQPKQALPGLWPIVAGRRFWAAAIVVVGTQTVWHVYRVWLIKFLQAGRGYGERGALDFMTFYFIAANVGCFAAGLATLWLVRRRGTPAHRAQRNVYAGACALTSLSLLIPWLEKGWLLLAVLLLVGAGGLGLMPSYLSYVQELSAAHVGRLTGLLSAWVWAVTSPLHTFVGMLADRTGSYDLGLVVAGLAPWLGAAAMGLLWPLKAEPAART